MRKSAKALALAVVALFLWRVVVELGVMTWMVSDATQAGVDVRAVLIDLDDHLTLPVVLTGTSIQLLGMLAISYWLGRELGAYRDTFAIGRNPIGVPTLLAAVGVGVGTLGVSSAVHWLLEVATDVGPPVTQASVVAMLRDSSPLGVLAFVGVAGILAPICEELTVRGYLWKLAEGLGRGRRGQWAAWAVTSVLFAAIHVEPAHALGVLAGALLLGWIRLVTRSVVPCVVAHLTTNVAGTALLLCGVETSWILATAVVLAPAAAFLVNRYARRSPSRRIGSTPSADSEH